jgi:AsmA protein
MRRVGIILGVLIGLIVIAALIFVATFDVNKYHGTIQSELQNRLGRPVILGNMHLSIFPPRFRVENPAIGDDPHFSSVAPFIKAQELAVSVKLLPLLHKRVEIHSLELNRPSVNLIKNSAGVWNFASLGHPSAGTSSEAPGPTPPERPPSSTEGTRPSSAPATSSSEVTLGALTITDGQISVLDEQKSKVPSLYDHIDITLKNFSPDKPFTVTGAVRMAGPGSQQLRLEGDGGPVVNADPASTPFRGTLSLKQVDISDLSKFLNSPALTGTDGTMSGETKISNQAASLTAQGEIQIQNAKLRGMELGYPITAQYDLTDDQASNLITLRKFILKLGSTPLVLSGTVNSKSKPLTLDLNVMANNVSIAEAAKLAAASGVTLSQGTNATGNVNVNVQVRGAADKPALNGTIAAKDIQLSGKDIPQPIQIPTLSLSLTPSQIQSSPFNVISGGTTLNTEFALRNYASPSPSMDASLRAVNAQLPAILSVAKAYGVTSLDKVSGSGTMNMDMHAVGPLRSVNKMEMLRTLNGTVDLNFNNVRYSGANISRELSAIAGFLNASAASQSAAGVTDISTMTGRVSVKSGIAETNNLQAKLDVGNVGAVGTANLIDETLNMRVTAVLSQSTSQKVGGNSVAGFMQTALANKQGELVIPALVTGTFSKPKFSPDIQQIAQMKVKGLVPNFGDPGSLTGTLQHLLGVSGNPQSAPHSQGQTQPQQQNPVQQLMGIFGKKKPNQQSPK